MNLVGSVGLRVVVVHGAQRAETSIVGVTHQSVVVRQESSTRLGSSAVDLEVLVRNSPDLNRVAGSKCARVRIFISARATALA